MEMWKVQGYRRPFENGAMYMWADVSDFKKIRETEHDSSESPLCIYRYIIMDDEQTVGGLLKVREAQMNEMSATAVAVVSAERMEDNMAQACSACFLLL